MPADLVPFAADTPLAVCRVRESAVVHLVREPDGTLETESLCGGSVVPGRPDRTLVQSPCGGCVQVADAAGLRTVQDLTSAWVNLSRLAGWLRLAA